MPGASLLLSPVALIARICLHKELRLNGGAWKSGVQISLSAIVAWGAKLCGAREEFKAAARWIDIASCGVILSDAMEALAVQVTHLYAFALYGTSLETPLQKAPSYDFERLSQLAHRFFLALANFHLALSGEGSEYLLFSNIEFLVRQFRFKSEKFTSQLENLLPQQDVGPATAQLLASAYDKTHGSTTDKVMDAAKSLLTSIGLRTEDTPQEERVEIQGICWTATPALC